MIIEVFERLDTEGGELKTLEEIEVEGLDASSIKPVRDKVGSQLSLQDLKDLSAQAQPVYRPDEPDSYYSQNIEVWVDGNLSGDVIDIPHHIGFRVVAVSILRKYAARDNVMIQIG